ncbi:hypothetical protein LPJ64_004893, partial [Coemansia asiatica]
MQLIVSEDIQYFIARCKQHGQMPVPFVPILDKDLGMFMLKGSHWQSENVDLIADQDPDRTVIQQGVVSVKYSTKVNEPVKAILDSVYHGHIAALLERQYGSDGSRVPIVEFIASNITPKAALLPANVVLDREQDSQTFSLPWALDALPSEDLWLDVLAGQQCSWLYFLLTSKVLVKGSLFADNFVQCIMRARPGRTFTIALQDNGIPLHVEISKTDRAGNQFTEVMLAFDRDASQITLQVFQPKPSGTAVLCLSLDYLPEYPLAPIHLDTKQFSSEISRFYADTWVDNSDSPAAFKDITSGIQAISTSGLVITEDRLHDFCNLISSSSKWYVSKN